MAICVRFLKTTVSGLASLLLAESSAFALYAAISHGKKTPWIRNRCNLACVLMGLLLALTSTHSLAKNVAPVHDCCGEEHYVYHPSKDRIKITNSAEVAKQITSSQKNSDESQRLTKAIQVGNYVLQAYVNKDLFSYGSAQEPPEIREGWEKYYAPYISVGTKEIDEIYKNRSPNCCYAGVSKDPRHNRMVCPAAHLASVIVQPQKTLLTYQFIQIARHAGLQTGIGVVDHPLELADKGKIKTFSIALNRDFKYVPNDPDTPDWWSPFTTKAFKESLTRHIKSHYGPDQQYKPKLRELLTHITDAEKVCQQKNLFDQ